MKLGVRAKLFLVSVGVILASVVVAYSYMRASLEERLIQRIRDDLEIRAGLVAERARSFSVGLDDLRAWDELADEFGARARARVTLISPEGRVIGDSEVSLSRLPSVDNHKYRPEVRRALRGEVGISRRVSRTVKQALLYVAVPLELEGGRRGVARVAMPLTEVDRAVRELRETLVIAAALALAVAVFMSSIAAQLVSRNARALTQVASRMADGDLDARCRLEGRDELAALGAALDQLAKNLSRTLGALRGERDRLSGILEGMQEGVLFLDSQGRVALINPALREMLLLAADSKGKSLLEVIRHADLKQIIDDAQATSEPVTREIEVTGLKPRRLLVRVAPLQGSEAGLFGVFVDMTEIRRLESVRKDFVANVSHELRTPVTAIRSAAETLEVILDADVTAAQKFVHIIDRNAQRLHDLVEDLLDLSRIESREFRLRPEDLRVDELFAHMQSLFRDRAEKKRIKIETEADAGLSLVRADRRALEHVLSNLVDNAVKYCGSGAQIRLTASELSDRVELAVADTGPGIDKAHLPRLFERFYRVDAGRSRELGGTGLGLSIVKHLIESMSGQVGVKSRLGRGTTFSFTLPKANSDAPNSGFHPAAEKSA